MNPELSNFLYEQFPKIFVDVNKSASESCMAYGICCEDGWFHLIKNLCLEIQEYIDSSGGRDFNTVVPQVVARQVKQKLGSLRFIYSGGDDYINNIVLYSERLSYRICERCGRFDHEVGMTSGYIQPLCLTCSKKARVKINRFTADQQLSTLWNNLKKE